MTITPLEQLRALVLSDPALQASLQPLSDRREFVAACLAIARKSGLEIAPAALEHAVRAGRHEWYKRQML